MDLLLQRHYLTAYNALFSENFYGLERMKSLPKMEEPVGRNVDILRTLLICVVVPYVKGKLDGIFEKLREEEADGMGPNTSMRKIISYLRFY